MHHPDLTGASSQPWYNPGYLTRQGFLDRLYKHGFVLDSWRENEDSAPMLAIKGAVNGATFGCAMTLHLNPLADHRDLLDRLYRDFQDDVFKARLPEMVGHA